MVFYTLVLQLYLKNGQRKEDETFMVKQKSHKKQNSAAIMISVDGKGVVFPMKWKLQGNHLRKDITFFI